MTRHLPARAAAAALGAFLPLALLAGCTYTSPATTTLDYAPSDGIELGVADVTLLNAIVVSDGDGAPGVLTATLVNEGADPVVASVVVAETAELAVVELAPGQVVRLGNGAGDGEVPAVLGSVDVVSGAKLPLTLNVPQGGGARDAQVTVLPPLREYASVTPTAPAEPEPEPEPEPAVESPADAGPTAEPTGGAEPTADPEAEASPQP